MKNNIKGNYLTVILILLICLLFFRYCYKQNEINKVSNNDKVTRIIVSKDTILNLGLMKASIKKYFKNTIKNIGPNTLYISGIAASCGCTEIKVNKKKCL
jgi:hypothetical protein